MGCAENGHTANSICDNKKFDNGNGYRQSKWLHKYIFANVYLITILQNMENTNIEKQKDFHADKLKSPGLDSTQPNYYSLCWYHGHRDTRRAIHIVSHFHLD